MKLYSVKQASKLLHLSTNTVYKYLDEGIIKATRSGPNGRFRITKAAMEEYIGVKLPSLKSYSTPKTDTKNEQTKTDFVPALGIKIARTILILLLLLFMADLYLNPLFSITTQAARVVLVFLLIVLTYQFGGIRGRSHE